MNRPAVTITNLNRQKKVAPGWFVQVGNGPGKRFSEEEWRANGIAWINERLTN